MTNPDGGSRRQVGRKKTEWGIQFICTEYIRGRYSFASVH